MTCLLWVNMMQKCKYVFSELQEYATLKAVTQSLDQEVIMKKLYVSLALLSSLVCVSSAFADLPPPTGCSDFSSTNFSFTKGIGMGTILLDPSVEGDGLPNVPGFTISKAPNRRAIPGQPYCATVTITKNNDPTYTATSTPGSNLIKTTNKFFVSDRGIALDTSSKQRILPSAK